MAKSWRNTAVVATAKQRAALASPVRMETLEQFGISAPASVAEVAERLGRSPESLYYHVRQLVKTGLLVQAGSRKSGKRDEALYQPVAQQISQQCDRNSASDRRAVADTLGTLLRVAERDAVRAIGNPDTSQSGSHRTFYFRRLPCHLSKNALAKINSHIDAIERIARQERAKRPTPSDADVTCSILLALAPMNRGGDADDSRKSTKRRRKSS